MLFRSYSFSPASSPYVRNGLTSCAQVCGFWASICRPTLFKEITIQSGEELLQLLEFINAKPLNVKMHSIRELIQKITLDTESSSTPWLYLVPLLVLPQLPSLNQVILQTREGWTLQPSFKTLPVKPSHLQLQHLILDGIHFHSGNELIRLLQSFTSITDVYLYSQIGRAHV